MATSPVMPKEETRIVLSILAGKTTVVEATRQG